MKYLIWLICLVSLILAYEPTAHREFLDGTEGHLKYRDLHLENNRREYRLIGGLTLAAYGQEKGVGEVEVNFVNFIDSRNNDTLISNETPLEELQITTRFISQALLADTLDPETAKLCWMIEARGDIKFVVVDIPNIAFLDLSSLEGLRESQRKFYLSSAVSYQPCILFSGGFKSTTLMEEYEIPDSGSIIHYSWRHSLNAEIFLDYKSGIILGSSWVAISSKHHKPEYEFNLHARTPIVTDNIPVCLEINYRFVRYNYTGNNYPELSVAVIAINL